MTSPANIVDQMKFLIREAPQLDKKTLEWLFRKDPDMWEYLQDQLSDEGHYPNLVRLLHNAVQSLTKKEHGVRFVHRDKPQPAAFEGVPFVVEIIRSSDKRRLLLLGIYENGRMLVEVYGGQFQ